MTFARTVLLSLALQQASAGYYSGIVGQFGTYDAIAGYTPASDVTAHAAIDLDMTAINDYAGSGDFDSAIDMYKNGGNSAKGSGWRTLHGFGVKDLSGETEYDMGVTYWGSATYANDIVMAALNGTDYSDPKGSTSVTLTDTQRSQIISKGAAYINAWIYALHELYEAEEKCEMYVSDKAGYFAAGYAHPYKEMHYWDEGWAFYAGSQQEVGSTSTGDLAYELAEKRCSDFNTCGPAGYVEGVDGNQGSDFRPSLVNRNLIALYNAGLVQLNSSDCTGVSTTIGNIVKQMTIPLIQGTIKYVYKSDPAGGASGTASSDEKAMAEGWAFAAALLPMLNDASSSAATTLYNNINMGLGTSGAVPDGYAAVKAAIEGAYSALGITCADVGEYYGMLDDADYVECSGLTPGTATVYSDVITMGIVADIDSEWPYSTIAGYAPLTNVIDHAAIDLDQTAINDACSDGDWATANDIYSNGQNSPKGAGFRTLSGFSKNLAGETAWDAGYAYWGDEFYADDIVSAALSGSTYAVVPDGVTDTGVGNLTTAARKQIVSKTSAYINAWVYSLHELHSAESQCESYESDSAAYAYDWPYKSVHYWDEGWAFYAGSQQAVGSTSTGDLAYELAEKRCTNFGTCGAYGNDATGDERPSLVNRNLLYLYNQGLEQIQAVECTSLSTTITDIISQMIIPLVQGVIKYVYYSDSANFVTDDGENEEARAEGWAFSAALLPFLNDCDSAVATTLYNNINMGLGTDGAVVADSFATIKSAIESTYTCLGITCSDVGGATSGYTACSDSSTMPTIYGAASTGFTDTPTASPVVGGSTAGTPTASPVAAASTSGASRGAISTAAVALASMLFAVMQL